MVVDARGDMTAGVFGEMMLTYFKGRGGAGMVIDGCLRDYPNLKRLDLPLWLRGWTPNFHTQTGLMPFAVNVPIACGGVTVIPGDIIVADDDGAVVLPVALAAKVIEGRGSTTSGRNSPASACSRGRRSSATIPCTRTPGPSSRNGGGRIRPAEADLGFDAISRVTASCV